jgi:adenosylcobinamide-GDP ribazoletransferase
MDSRRGIFADFLLATAVLTRLPVGVAAPGEGGVAGACWAFPLVGAGVGFISGAVFFAAGRLGVLPAALLAVLAGMAVTGALH